MTKPPLSIARKSVTLVSRLIPRSARCWLAREISIRSLRTARDRCTTVQELSALTFTWKGYGKCFSIQSLQLLEEQTEFFELVATRRPRWGLEIGTCNGGTLFMLAAVAADNAQLISIDLPGGIHGGGYSEAQAPFFERAFTKRKQRLHLLRADSSDPITVDHVQKLLNGEQLDYLFIDGDHRYQSVRRDFLNYAPLVGKGGLVAFHDVAPVPVRPGVEVPQLWRLLEDLAPSRTIIAASRPQKINAGIGIFPEWNPQTVQRFLEREKAAA